MGEESLSTFCNNVKGKRDESLNTAVSLETLVLAASCFSFVFENDGDSLIRNRVVKIDQSE